MSIFIPYSPSDVIQYFTITFSLNLSDLTPYQSLIITLLSNIYFYGYWFFICYFALKIFNRIWERFF